jgi:hypothetical protein
VSRVSCNGRASTALAADQFGKPDRIATGGRGSSAKASGVLSPKLDTFIGKSAPQMPGPRMASRRTMPIPSVTRPALMHSTSASWRHGSRSAKKNPPVQAESIASPAIALARKRRRAPGTMSRENAMHFVNVSSRFSPPGKAPEAPLPMVKMASPRQQAGKKLTASRVIRCFRKTFRAFSRRTSAKIPPGKLSGPTSVGRRCCGCTQRAG